MSEPNTSKVPADLFALGNVEAEYIGSNLLVSGLAVAAICLVGGVVQLALYFGTGYFFPVLAVLTPIGLLGGLALMVQGLVEGRRRALVFKDAIAVVRRGKTTTMRWDDVTAVYQKVTVTRQRSGKTPRPRFTYTLRGKDGSMTLSAYKNIEALGKTIQTEVNRRLAPRYTEAYNRGETVTFGKVKLSKAGLDIGGGLIPWAQVEQVSFSLGKLNVRRNGQWTEVVGQTAAQTPNLTVLMGLIQQNTHPLK